MQPSLTLPTGEFFQLGYVTTNLDRAIEDYKRHHGVKNFLTFDTSDFAESVSSGPFMTVALAYHGPVMIELIEPDATNAGIYQDALRIDGGIALHHLGYLIEEAIFDPLIENFERNQVAIPVIRNSLGMSLLYADTRDQNSLFSEFVCKSKACSDFFAQVPRN